jgi:hypothetical protein
MSNEQVFKLFNTKFNYLMDIYVYSCIIKDCDFKIHFDMPKFKKMPVDDKWAASMDRDRQFESHLRLNHGLDSMYFFDYQNLVHRSKQEMLNQLDVEEEKT